jgi:hypothetical protein
MAAIQKLPIKKITIAGVLYALVFATAPEKIGGYDSDTKCGGNELWDKKVLLDDSVKKLVKDKSATTIKALNLVDTEQELENKKARMSFEKRIVTVKNVLIRLVKLEDDNDYHLVIQDRQGNHMIAEIIDPECDVAKNNTRYIQQFMDVRKVMKKYGTTFQHYEFEMTGVLFRDRPHDQTGKADNNLEIHPVLKLKAIKKLTY